MYIPQVPDMVCKKSVLFHKNRSGTKCSVTKALKCTSAVYSL